MTHSHEGHYTAFIHGFKTLQQCFCLCADICSISVAWPLVFAINISFFVDRWSFKSDLTGRSSSITPSSPGSITFLSRVTSQMHGSRL